MTPEKAADAAYQNREAIKASEYAGCYACLAIFKSSDVTEWIEDTGGDTAMCPKCEIDSVVPNPTLKLLKEAQAMWFERPD